MLALRQSNFYSDTLNFGRTLETSVSEKSEAKPRGVSERLMKLLGVRKDKRRVVAETPNSVVEVVYEGGKPVVLKKVKQSNSECEFDVCQLLLSLGDRVSDNILRVELAERVDSQIYLGFELCSLGDFHFLIYEDPAERLCSLPVVSLVSFTKQLAAALFCLHRQGIYHGDIKASNVFLTRDLRLKLGDFGNSRILGENSVVTSSGTIPYCAPEILFRQPHRFEPDWWSFGVFVAELFCGVTPFDFLDQALPPQGCLRGDERKLQMICRWNISQILDALQFPWMGVKDLVGRLLVRDVNRRLQPSNGLFHHPLFSV